MKKGFTLFELLIAAAISSIVALGLFAMFSSVVTTRDRAVVQSRNIVLQQSLTRLINKDARMMQGDSIKVDKSGQVYRLTFTTQNSLRFNKALPVDVTYYVDDSYVRAHMESAVLEDETVGILQVDLLVREYAEHIVDELQSGRVLRLFHLERRVRCK